MITRLIRWSLFPIIWMARLALRALRAARLSFLRMYVDWLIDDDERYYRQCQSCGLMNEAELRELRKRIGSLRVRRISLDRP